MESKQMYKGKIISVKVDKVQINKRQTIKEVVEHGGSAAILPLIGDTIVMEKQYRYPIDKELFEIPAGTLEKGESPEECAARELIEETGYKAGNLKQLGRFYMSPGYCTEVMHVFVATNLSKVESHGMDDDEVIEIVRVTVDDAVKMIMKGEIEDAKTVCAVLAYAQQSKR